MLNATVSGSFHRHIETIQSAVLQLRQLGVRVLSPSNPTIVGEINDFLFVAIVRMRSVRLFNNRFL